MMFCKYYIRLDSKSTPRCSLFKNTTVEGCRCPAFEEMQQTTVLENNNNSRTKERKKRQKIKLAEPVYVKYDGLPILKPLAHQTEAIKRYTNENEICLFFEMGCGKTFTTLQIASVKYRAGIINNVLVIAPNDVHKQWYDDLLNGVEYEGELYRQLDDDLQIQCVGGRGGQKEFYPFDSDKETLNIVTINIDTFSQPHKWEQIVEWSNNTKCMIIVDEATVIKNPSSKRSQRLLYEFNKVLKKGKAIIASTKINPIRVVLTGTPTTNGTIDLWAIMEFVKPNFFNRNYYSFRSRYGMFTKLSVSTGFGNRDVDVLLTEKTWEGIKKCETFEQANYTFGCSQDTYLTIKHQDRYQGPYKHIDELKEQLNTVAMFKKLTDCVDMPPVNYIVRQVGMSQHQEGAYKQMQKDLLATFGEYATTAANKMVSVIRLQQISSGFIMGRKFTTDEVKSFDERYNEDVTNSFDVLPSEAVWLDDSNPRLDALMRDISECDKPILVITRYTAEAAKIYELCEKQGYRTGLFTGWKVVGGIDEFKNGNLDILIANSSKVSRGFNLQVSHVTLFYSNSFSMEIRQQTEFRTFRLGQDKPCLYVDYIASHADEIVLDSLRVKKNLLEVIRSKDFKEIVE